ncbi:acyltransferase [Pedococcus bigeumensis]|uniref:acyltransferase family protein n=1 Tax=Pedococcus bigeumensis TaxID=433644 RepID=UPI002FEA7E3D
MPNPATPTSPRITTFDGLRGIAIVIVVLSHGWTLWPTDHLNRIPVLRGVFNSGNTAVTGFFAVGGFLLCSAVLAGGDGPGRIPWRLAARRFIRLSSQVYPLLLVVAVVSLLDPTDPATDQTNRRTFWSVATYTWNWLLQTDSAEARQDLGHLWYVSVDLQVSLLLVVLVWVLRRRLPVLLGVLALGVVVVMVWRAHILDVEGWVSASLRTTTRCDPILGGALAAVATRLHPLGERAARLLATSGAVGLVIVVASAGGAGDLAYLGWAGAAAVVATVALVAGLAAPSRPLSRQLGLRSLRRLGTLSLALYVWHYPVFWAVARHSHGWSWVPRTLVAVALTALVAVVTERLCERPTQGWLRRPRAETATTASVAS